MKYYVKRCIALPGDTLEIRKGYYHIKGITDSVGNVQAQHRIARVRREDSHGIVMDAFPWDGRLGWTIQEFGPLPVPAKGQVVKIDTLSCLLYGRLIHWEQKKRLRQKGEAVCLGDSAITEYKFTENYYFVSGDNMENSKDSRYWGMLPESYIVGRAFTIWRSDDPLRGKIRWNRVFKRIK
jgi:signal peptidase I